VLREAQVLAYNHVFQVVAGTFAVVFPMVFWLRKAQGRAEVEVAAD